MMLMKTLSSVMTAALLAAGSSPLVVKTWLDSVGKPVAVKAAPSVQVLVMARDVPAGTVLQAEDLRYDYWPVYQLSDQLVIKAGVGVDAKAPYIGRVARRYLSEGAPFAADQCAPSAGAEY
jgi:Flp pilus assembly protein CpaB